MRIVLNSIRTSHLWQDHHHLLIKFRSTRNGQRIHIWKFGSSEPVVLRREPFGSLREEFLFLGRKFVPERNCGGKAVDEKTWSFYHWFIQHMKAIVQRGWFRWKCLQNASQAASSSSFEPVLSVHFLVALDLGARVEQPMEYLITQNRQVVQCMGRQWRRSTVFRPGPLLGAVVLYL